MTHPQSWILLVLLAAGCEGDTTAPAVSAPEEQPEGAPDPEPVYTSAVCCAPGRICTLDDGAPLGTTCACPNPEGSVEGHVC